MKTITRTYIALAMAGLSVSACTNNKVLHGAAIGAGGGAVVGALIPGLSIGEGALIGGAGGAVVGALDKDKGGRHYRWHRDSRGNEYRETSDGRRIYRD